MKKYSFILLFSFVSLTAISQNFKLNSLSENTKVLDIDSLDFNKNKIKVDFTDPDVNIGEYYSAYWLCKKYGLTHRWTSLILFAVGSTTLTYLADDNIYLIMGSAAVLGVGLGFGISSLVNHVKAYNIKIKLGRKLPNEYFQLNL